MEDIWSWMRMEGYGAYIWGAYGFTLAMLSCLAGHLRTSARKAKVRYAKLVQRETLQGDASWAGFSVKKIR